MKRWLSRAGDRAESRLCSGLTNISIRCLRDHSTGSTTTTTILALLLLVSTGSTALSIQSENQPLQLEAEGEAFVLSRSSSFHWSRMRASGGLFAEEQLYQPSWDDFRFLGWSYPMLGMQKPAYKGSYLVVGNEIGDPLYQELAYETRSGNRTPMMDMGLHSPQSWMQANRKWGVETWAAFRQVDHMSVQYASERSLMTRGEDNESFAWFGENYPPYSQLISGAAFESGKNRAFRADVRIRDQYYWLYDILGNKFPIHDKGMELGLTYHSVRFKLTALDQEFENHFLETEGKARIYQGKIHAGEVSSIGSSLATGFEFAIYNPEGDYPLRWYEDRADTARWYKAFPYLQHRLEGSPGGWSWLLYWTGWHLVDDESFMYRDTMGVYWDFNPSIVRLEARAKGGTTPDPMLPYQDFYLNEHWHEQEFSLGYQRSKRGTPIHLDLFVSFWNSLLPEQDFIARGVQLGRSLKFQSQKGFFTTLQVQREWLFGKKFTRAIETTDPSWANAIRVLPPEYLLDLCVGWKLPTGLQFQTRAGWQSESEIVTRLGEEFHIYAINSQWHWDVELRQSFFEDRLQFFASFLNILSKDKKEHPFGNEVRFRVLTGVEYAW